MGADNTPPKDGLSRNDDPDDNRFLYRLSVNNHPDYQNGPPPYGSLAREEHQNPRLIGGPGTGVDGLAFPSLPGRPWVVVDKKDDEALARFIQTTEARRRNVDEYIRSNDTGTTPNEESFSGMLNWILESVTEATNFDPNLPNGQPNQDGQMWRRVGVGNFIRTDENPNPEPIPAYARVLLAGALLSEYYSGGGNSPRILEYDGYPDLDFMRVSLQITENRQDGGSALWVVSSRPPIDRNNTPYSLYCGMKGETPPITPSPPEPAPAPAPAPAPVEVAPPPASPEYTEDEKTVLSWARDLASDDPEKRKAARQQIDAIRQAIEQYLVLKKTNNVQGLEKIFSQLEAVLIADLAVGFPRDYPNVVSLQELGPNKQDEYWTEREAAILFYEVVNSVIPGPETDISNNKYCRNFAQLLRDRSSLAVALNFAGSRSHHGYANILYDQDGDAIMTTNEQYMSTVLGKIDQYLNPSK